MDRVKAAEVLGSDSSQPTLIQYYRRHYIIGICLANGTATIYLKYTK